MQKEIFQKVINILSDPLNWLKGTPYSITQTEPCKCDIAGCSKRIVTIDSANLVHAFYKVCFPFAKKSKPIADPKEYLKYLTSLYGDLYEFNDKSTHEELISALEKARDSV